MYGSIVSPKEDKRKELLGEKSFCSSLNVLSIDGLASALLGSHDVIATDGLGGLLHASFQFAESPADADTIMRLRIFALALRTEGRCQRFAF